MIAGNITEKIAILQTKVERLLVDNEKILEKLEKHDRLLWGGLGGLGMVQFIISIIFHFAK